MTYSKVTAGTWRRDEAAFDPCRRIMTVTYEAKAYEVSNISGPGWYMHIRQQGASIDGYIGMANWEDWPDVERQIKAWLVKQAV